MAATHLLLQQGVLFAPPCARRSVPIVHASALPISSSRSSPCSTSRPSSSVGRAFGLATSRRRAGVLLAASAAAAWPSQPAAAAPSSEHRLQTACKAVFVATAASALWCVLASAFTGGAPFASLSLTASSPASSSGVELAAKSAWTGLAAGVLHTLCGPDHLAALTPLTIGRSRARATALGALWGFGHSTGQLILGLVFILLKERFNDFMPALARWSSTVVGLTLLAIGALGLYETYFDTHEEEEQEPQLAMAGAGMGQPVASSSSSSSSSSSGATKKGLATYATGIVYGLQPDALFVVVPALALPTKLAATAYCLMFVIGTVAAMGGYTLVIGTTSAALTKERPWLQSHLSTIASCIAILVGVLILLSGAGVEVPFIS